MRSFDVGDATWCDIDTIEDLHSAEVAARQLRSGRAAIAAGH